VGTADVVRWESFLSFIFTAGKVVAKVALVDNLSLLTVLVVSHILLKRVAYSKTVWTDIRMALVLSSYFKLFVFAMMVWEFSPLMAFIIDMLVLSSNTVAIKGASSLLFLIALPW
jgi:hypothetical protein